MAPSPAPFLGVRVVPADERFAGLGTHAEPDGSEFLETGYRCPEGPPGVSFRWRDIAERTIWGANLRPDEISALRNPVTAALGGPPPRSGYRVAIDFRCPRCGRAVVVVFRDLEISKNEWTYQPDSVLEVDQPRDIRAR